MEKSVSVRICTSLIEFEESPGTKTFFELEDRSKRPTCLFVVLEDRLLASLEIVRGTLDEEIDLIFERSIESEVNGFSGFISKLDAEFPDDVSTKFNVESKEVNQYHIFKFGAIALSAHLTVLSDWHEEDLAKYRFFLDNLLLLEDNYLNYEIGEILDYDEFDEHLGSSVGKRSYLGNQLIAIE